MTDLSSAVCSVTPTQRRRFFWAAWWTAAPRYAPFQKPDASNGGAKSIEEALREAERVSGRHLSLIDPSWARAWNRSLRGEPPTPPRERKARAAEPRERPGPRSPWEILGLAPGASADDIKRAFRKEALIHHPDRGGSDEAFRAIERAYASLLKRGAKKPRAKSGHAPKA